MEIRIKRIGTEEMQGDGSETIRTYLVVDQGTSFRIIFRSHRHGCSMGIEGREGFLYTDTENDTVRCQVVSIGPACGVSIRSDEPVEGLSPWSIRGVIFAERNGETREITITTKRAGDTSGEPLVLVDGVPVTRKIC